MGHFANRISNAPCYVKLEIRLFVMNFNSRGSSLRVLYCVVDTGYGLGRSLGDCSSGLAISMSNPIVRISSFINFLLAKGSVL